MKLLIKIILPIFLFVIFTEVTAQRNKKSNDTPVKATIASETAGMIKKEGFFNFYWDENQANVYLEIDKLDSEFLYVNSLAAGIGSNDIGLDRGQLGNERIVRFEKRGNTILMIQPNYDYRAVSDNEDEVKSVKEAFASSVIWGFPIKKSENGRHLVNFTDFLMRDSHFVSQRLSRSKQGSYKIDKSRSALYKENTLAFPKNSEFEAILTFTGNPAGGWIRSVTPSPEAITVRTHHSLIELPDSNYSPRRFDPRSGYIHIKYQDYATPIESSLIKRYVVRHRLERKDPSAATSEAVEPIIYYLDRGAPEPVRSALLDGARWWNQAFEAAGYENAFQVQLLPEGAHPLDVRYNVIQWVHRSTRGWSYGSSVVDPRTGEIIKGHVSLGSLRVRQDFLIAQGLLNQYDEGTDPMKELALARLRQLSAHEVGHTIGIVHNYASSINDRASVMDYPHPYVKLDSEGNIDLSEAYDTKIGEWDKMAIRYGYSDFGNQNEEGKLNDIITETLEKGLLFITDRDSRPQNGAHPTAHLWDNGLAAEELNRMMAIRRKVLDNFSEASLPEGEPYSSLEEVLVPMYLFHRFQVEAASKVVGGINYSYAVKGDGQIVTELIPASDQMKAVDALIGTVTPDALRLSEDVLSKIPPKAHGYNRSRETFVSATGPVWDYYGAIESASQMPLSFLLSAERANRLVTLNDRNMDQPGLKAVLDKLIDKTFKSPSSESSDRAIQRIVEDRIVDYMIRLASNSKSQTEVKSTTTQTLDDLSNYMNSRSGSFEEKAHYGLQKSKINSWIQNPKEVIYEEDIKIPDGSPIGSTKHFSCDF